MSTKPDQLHKGFELGKQKPSFEGGRGNCKIVSVLSLTLIDCRHRFKSSSAASYHDFTLTPLYQYNVETVVSQIKGLDQASTRFI